MDATFYTSRVEAQIASGLGSIFIELT